MLKQNYNKRDKIAQSFKLLNKDKIRLKMNKNKTIKLRLYHKQPSKIMKMRMDKLKTRHAEVLNFTVKVLQKKTPKIQS